MNGRQGGFTLVELLAAICIIAVLFALSMAGFKKLRETMARSVAVTQMRQVGVALPLYAADNNGSLPGPLTSSQGAIYIPSSQNQLATVLGPYLGVTKLNQASLVKPLLPPAYMRAMKGLKAQEARPYVLNLSVTIDGAQVQPWGSTTAPQAGPMKLAALPRRTWVICDADQLNPQVKGQPWASKTPTIMVHGKERLALYFDGSVTSISDSTLRMSAAPAMGLTPLQPPK